MVNLKKLKNGITLIVHQVPEISSMAYSFHMLGGLQSDPEDKLGASLILTEMTSRAGGNYDKVQFSQELDKYGINHSENASFDSFNYSGVCLASESRKALELLSCMVVRPTFPEDTFLGMQNIFLQDLKVLEDNASRKAMFEFNKKYFPPPHNRSGLGTESGLLNTSYSTIKDLWQKTYSPQGAVLSLAGNINEDEISKIVEEYFGNWSGNLYDLAKYQGDKNFFKTHIDFDSNQTQIIIAHPSVKVLDDQYYVAQVANQILSGGMFGRLFEEVREKRGLCYSVSSSFSATLDYGRVLYYAGTTTERAQETLSVMIDVVNSIVGTIKDSELHRAKIDLLSGFIIGNESTKAKAFRNYIEYHFRNKIRCIDEVKEKINSVTISDLDTYFKKYNLSNYSLLTLGKDSLV